MEFWSGRLIGIPKTEKGPPPRCQRAERLLTFEFCVVTMTSPVLPAPPFPPPDMLVARRVTGRVISPEVSPDTNGNPLDLFCGDLKGDDSSDLRGNILVLEDPSSGESSRAYWLQRKLSKTTNGYARVGFLVRPTKTSGARRVEHRDGGEDEWCVQPSERGPYPFEMVAIKIQDRAKLEGKSQSAQQHIEIRDPMVEMSALQMVYANDLSRSGHVVCTREICSDDSHVYIIVPFHGEGSLFEYVMEKGGLGEGVARHFFQQIIRVRCVRLRKGLAHLVTLAIPSHARSLCTSGTTNAERSGNIPSGSFA